MAIPVIGFNPISSDESNPFLSGLMQSLAANQSILKTKSLPQAIQREAEKERMANQLAELQLQHAPTRLSQEEQRANLANALSAIELQYAPQEIRSQLASRDILSNLRQSKMPGNIYNPDINIDSISEGIPTNIKPGQYYVDQKTGQTRQAPTTANVNYLQRAVVSSDFLKNVLPEIAKGYEPYMGASGHALLALDAVRNYLGFGSPESIKRIGLYETAKSDVDFGTEVAMKAFGLTSTEHNAKLTRNIIEPRKYETSKTYDIRVSNELSKLASRQARYQEILESGYGGSTNGQSENITNLPQTSKQIDSLKKINSAFPSSEEVVDRIKEKSQTVKKWKYNPSTGRIE